MLPVQTNMMCIPNPLKTSSTNGFPRCKALRCSAARSHNLLFYREVCHLRKIAPRTSQHPPSARRFSVLRGWRGGRGGRSRGVKRQARCYRGSSALIRPGNTEFLRQKANVRATSQRVHSRKALIPRGFIPIGIMKQIRRQHKLFEKSRIIFTTFYKFKR